MWKSSFDGQIQPQQDHCCTRKHEVDIYPKMDLPLLGGEMLCSLQYVKFLFEPGQSWVQTDLNKPSIHLMYHCDINEQLMVSEMRLNSCVARMTWANNQTRTRTRKKQESAGLFKEILPYSRTIEIQHKPQRPKVIWDLNILWQ